MNRKTTLMGILLCMVLITSTFFGTVSGTRFMGVKSQFICVFEEEGRFESGGWITDEKVTKDDFDDTGNMRWAHRKYKGIYSEVRTDEDLWDQTTEGGAWCCAAKEKGGFLRSEHSEGWAEVRRSFCLEEYVGDSVFNPSFRLTSASLGFDYKIWSFGLNHHKSWVCLKIYLSLNSGQDDYLVGPPLCWGEKYESSDPSTRENNVRRWDMESGESIDDFLDKHRFEDITLKFKLEISLYGRWRYGGRARYEEWFMFWLDDVKMCLVYVYEPSDSLVHIFFDEVSVKRLKLSEIGMKKRL